MRQPLNARREELRIPSDKPEPRPLVLERMEPEKSRTLAVIIRLLTGAAILLMVACGLFLMFRSW